MTKVPREIDELMWEVAEMDDLDTIDQFGARYPEFRNELVKRLHMVRSLRGSRPTNTAPVFIPRQNVRNFGPSRLAMATVAVIVLASVTFATYATMQYVRSHEQPAESIGTNVVFNPPNSNPGPPPPGGTPPRVEQTPFELPPGSEQPLREFDTFLFPVTIESVDTSLVAVINEIARLTGAEIVIAPGFEDKSISLTYVDQPAIGVLQHLGVMFGFTASRQGASSMIIFPATDESASPSVPVRGAAILNTARAQDEPDDTADQTTSDDGDPETLDKSIGRDQSDDKDGNEENE